MPSARTSSRRWIRIRSIRIALAYVNATKGAFKARVGRQDFDFDLQRFVSSRDGAECAPVFRRCVGRLGKRSLALYRLSVTVQYHDLHRPLTTRRTVISAFTSHERQVLGTNELSGYYSFYQNDNVRYLDASGDEKRNVFDGRFAGKLFQVDSDIEPVMERRHGSRTIQDLGGRNARRIHVRSIRVAAAAGAADGCGLDVTTPVTTCSGPSIRYLERLLFHAGRLHGLRESHPRQTVPDGEAGAESRSWAHSASAAARDHRRRNLRATQHSGRRHRKRQRLAPTRSFALSTGSMPT